MKPTWASCVCLGRTTAKRTGTVCTMPLLILTINGYVVYSGECEYRVLTVHTHLRYLAGHYKLWKMIMNNKVRQPRVVTVTRLQGRSYR